MLFVCIVLSDCVNGRYTAQVTWLWEVVGGPTHGAGVQEALRTSVIMPISDRRKWWECSKGDLIHHHTSVCLL